MNNSIALIEKLIKSGRPMNISSEIKQRVAERALAKKDSYHRDKNSVADAIIIELYAQSLSSPRNRRIKHAFLSHNIRDFSDTAGDQRKPHGDLLNLFGSTRSTYWISMPDFINSIDPDLVADHDMDLSFSQQPRRLSEILEAEHLLFRQVWYNRHWNLRTEIEEGTHHVVAAKDYSTKPYRQDQTLNLNMGRRIGGGQRTRERRYREIWDRGQILNGECSTASCLRFGGLWETSGTCSTPKPVGVRIAPLSIQGNAPPRSYTVALGRPILFLELIVRGNRDATQTPPAASLANWSSCLTGASDSYLPPRHRHKRCDTYGTRDVGRLATSYLRRPRYPVPM